MNAEIRLEKRKAGGALPYIITGVFLCFFGFIGFFVFQAMQTDVNLVSKDYYQKELAFQQHIDQVNRTSVAGREVVVLAPAGANQVILNIPGQGGKSLTGYVNFFRPADAALDFELPLQLNSDGNQIINTEKLAKGLWRVKISFRQGNQQYFKETALKLH